MDQPDLNLLATLDALLQEGSVSKAATRLGLSTPAVSHALARLRGQMGDPLLVRAGKGMVLSPKGLEMRDRLHALVAEAQALAAPPERFSPQHLERTFTLFTTDHALMVLGDRLNTRIRQEAPGVSLRFLPSNLDDVEPLRQGLADLAICLLGHYPPEIRSRRLFTDRFVVVGRKGHPGLHPGLTLEEYLGLEHGVVAPLGKGSHVDAALGEMGLSRRVTWTVPFFGSALDLVDTSDVVFTLSDRAAASRRHRQPLEIVEPPLVLTPYALNLIWHPRSDRDPGHAWFRELLLQVAAEAAPESHEGAQGNMDVRSARRRSRT